MLKNIFHSDFDTHSVRDWEKIAQQELGNKNPWENLTQTKQGTTVKPYYDKSDTIEEKKLRFSGTASCLNVPRVIVSDEKKANGEALTHLNTGADGIWFEILQAVNANKLLDKIELPACSLYFSSKDDVPLNSLADFIESKAMSEKITGAFFTEKDGNILSRIKSWKNFLPQGIIVKKNVNIVDEIVDSLLTTVDRVELLKKESFSVEATFHSLAYSISVDTDFFLSIAKIRALKNLYITLQEAYQIEKPIQAFVHAQSQPWIKENFQPHGNMLKQTTAAMACAMSGCNAITIEPESSDNKMMSRIARNVSLMLHEESHFAEVNDPLAGSFYVDALTNQIARESWKKFQQR
jgi:methylmalonyl-CoA mutase